MRLLILSRNYPNLSCNYAQTYIHTRSLAYLKLGLKFDIISYDCKNEYEIDNVKVYPAKSFKTLLVSNKYSVLICHAPNLRHHLKTLILNFSILPKLFFIFHGHEILIKSKFYPQPFNFKRKWYNTLSKILNETYDFLKLTILQLFIKKYIGKKLYIIFVSNYLKSLFLKNISLPIKTLENETSVINNPLNNCFFNYKYYFSQNKTYDFITIRSYDKAVYAIDVVVKIAMQNPKNTFHIYGKGDYFKYNSKPENIKLYNTYLTPIKIAKILNKYKAALMPSYHDTQGVMACEMAIFGIPMIVSDIAATKEMLKYNDNTVFIDNINPTFNANAFFKSVKEVKLNRCRLKFSYENTVLKELEFIKSKL